MSKLINVLLLPFCLALVSSNCWAYGDGEVYPEARPMAPETYGASSSKQPETYGSAISNKLGAAVGNVVFGWLEIPKNMINTTNEANVALGLIGGPLKGVLHSMGRAMAGVFDLITFPVPTKPLTTPKLVWQDWPLETRYNRIEMAPTR